MVSWWMAGLIGIVGGLAGGFLSAAVVASHHEELSSDLLERWEGFVNHLRVPDTQRAMRLASRAAKDIDQALTDIRVLGWSTTVLGGILTAIGIVVGLAGPSLATWITEGQWPPSPPSWLPIELLRAMLVLLGVLAVVLLAALLAVGPVDTLIRRINRSGTGRRQPALPADSAGA